MSGTSYLSFVCSACERESKEWVAYCPQCRQWDTYTIEKGERKTPLPAASFSEWAANP
jgi:predicted ATP-dependent serine protease